MKVRLLLCSVIASLAAGCVTPQLNELRALQPNEQFIVHANLDCLFNKGVEHVSSYIGMTEPRFTWYLDPTSRTGWFRQPLTLVELQTEGTSSTRVRRLQTPSARSFGQGDQLVEFLKGNPCGDGVGAALDGLLLKTTFFERKLITA